jgi:hypothetical protein
MNNDDQKTPNQEAARVAQARERENHLKHNRQAEAVRRVFAESTVQFKVAPDAVLAALGTITFDADEQPRNWGKSLSDRLQDYAALNPQAVAGTVAERHDKGASTIQSKAELLGAKAKSDFISAQGLDAYSRLPLTTPETRQVPVEELSYAQYLKLPPRERSRIAGEKGSMFIAGLQRKAQEQSRYDRLVGIPVGKKR